MHDKLLCNDKSDQAACFNSVGGFLFNSPYLLKSLNQLDL